MKTLLSVYSTIFYLYFSLKYFIMFCLELQIFLDMLYLFLAFLQELIMFISKLCNTEHELNKSWINVIS